MVKSLKVHFLMNELSKMIITTSKRAANIIAAHYLRPWGGWRLRCLTLSSQLVAMLEEVQMVEPP